MHDVRKLGVLHEGGQGGGGGGAGGRLEEVVHQGGEVRGDGAGLLGPGAVWSKQGEFVIVNIFIIITILPEVKRFLLRNFSLSRELGDDVGGEAGGR